MTAAAPSTSLLVRGFLVALGLLLVGYMFMGRGFAHIGVGPVFIGDAVMVVGVVVAAVAMIRWRVRPPFSWTLGLLLAFAVLGAARTLPYIGVYGIDALRDGVLWGYAAFALIVYVLVDRWSVLAGFRAYGWIVPIFALWLPVSWNLFRLFSLDIDPTRPGSVIPLVYFKAGDMAVHVVGSVAFLILGAAAVASARTFVWRVAIFLPVLWTVFVAGTSNRGALVTAIIGVAVTVAIAPRARNWLPLIAATALFAVAVTVQAVLPPLASSSPATGNRNPEAAATASADGNGVPADAGPSGDERSTADPSERAFGSEGESEARETAATTEADSSDPAPGDAIELENGGFEEPPTADGLPPGWTAYGGARVSVDTDDPYRGSAYAVLENTMGPYEATLTSERFKLAGPDLRVSSWVKAIRGAPGLELYVNWYDAHGDPISSRFTSAFGGNGQGRWVECAGVIAGPPDAASAEILFYQSTSSGTLGIDSVVVRSGEFVPDPPPPASAEGRPATIGQIIENLTSIFGGTSDGGLEGTRQFRLAWWGTIVDYTIFGDYFWAGKGFGVNLADDDGFQSTSDGSLRAPHNSHLTVLARMGVPGFALWIALQVAFGVGVLRASLAHRRSGNLALFAVGTWILVYWLAMMVDTSFDPYLEGPQGGIWFWSLIGLGLVVMRLRDRVSGS
jgi:hypothetical protein